MEHVKLLEVIYRNAKRLQRLTEDILDVTKIESQSLTLEKEQFSLNELITNAIEDITKKKFYPHHLLLVLILKLRIPQ